MKDLTIAEPIEDDALNYLEVVKRQNYKAAEFNDEKMKYSDIQELDNASQDTSEEDSGNLEDSKFTYEYLDEDFLKVFHTANIF